MRTISRWVLLALIALSLGAGVGWLRALTLAHTRQQTLRRAQESKQALEEARRIFNLKKHEP